jgi:UDP-N-acetylmuramate--alanine ligase
MTERTSGPWGGTPPGIGDAGVVPTIHIVGVGGAGMSAIATVLHAMGHEVTGSDLRESGVTERLRALGIQVAIGHDAANVGDAGLVTHSTAVPVTNPEVAEARRRDIPVLTRAETLAAIAARKRCIAVAGTHGKTTTASMLALILVEAGLHPSFLIGGDVNEIGTNAAWDSGEWIVVEADESDGTFLHLAPDIAIVTNVEADHLDHYGSFDAVRTAFVEFLDSAGHRVVGSDDAEARAIGQAVGADLVGLGEDATHLMTAVAPGRSSIAFDLLGRDRALVVHLSVAVPGLHNAKNAAVATVAALVAGADPGAVARALARFGGVARRFEFRGELGGVTFVDDYAHLPTEVAAALAAARNGAWSRVVAVFQPHRYTRTSEVAEAFGGAFDDADVVVITDIYGAGEAPIPGVSGRLVADAVHRGRPDVELVYVASRTELVDEVATLLAPGDLCLTLGAGDLTSLPDELMAAGRIGPGGGTESP